MHRAGLLFLAILSSACSSTETVRIRNISDAALPYAVWAAGGDIQRIDVSAQDNLVMVISKAPDGDHSHTALDLDSHEVLWTRQYPKYDTWVRLGPYLHRRDMQRPLLFDFATRERLRDPIELKDVYLPESDLFLTINQDVIGTYRVVASRVGESRPIWVRSIGRRPPFAIYDIDAHRSAMVSNAIYFMDHSNGQGAKIDFKEYASRTEIELLGPESLLYTAVGLGLLAMTGNGFAGVVWRKHQTRWNSHAVRDGNLFILSDGGLHKVDLSRGEESFEVFFDTPLNDEAGVVPVDSAVYVLNRIAVIDSMTTWKAGISRILKFDSETGELLFERRFSSADDIHTDNRIQDILESGRDLFVFFENKVVVMDRFTGVVRETQELDLPKGTHMVRVAVNHYRLDSLSTFTRYETQHDRVYLELNTGSMIAWNPIEYALAGMIIRDDIWTRLDGNDHLYTRGSELRLIWDKLNHRIDGRDEWTALRTKDYLLMVSGDIFVVVNPN